MIIVKTVNLLIFNAINIVRANIAILLILITTDIANTILNNNYTYFRMRYLYDTIFTIKLF